MSAYNSQGPPTTTTHLAAFQSSMTKMSCYERSIYLLPIIVAIVGYLQKQDSLFKITGAWECSPVLMATHHFNGSFCDFPLFFFQGHAWGSDPSTNRHAKWLKRRGFGQGCAFCSKNWKFLYPLTTSPQKLPKFGPFWSGLRKFSL